MRNKNERTNNAPNGEQICEPNKHKKEEREEKGWEGGKRGKGKEIKKKSNVTLHYKTRKIGVYCYLSQWFHKNMNTSSIPIKKTPSSPTRLAATTYGPRIYPRGDLPGL